MTKRIKIVLSLLICLSVALTAFAEKAKVETPKSFILRKTIIYKNGLNKLKDRYNRKCKGTKPEFKAVGGDDFVGIDEFEPEFEVEQVTDSWSDNPFGDPSNSNPFSYTSVDETFNTGGSYDCTGTYTGYDGYISTGKTGSGSGPSTGPSTGNTGGSIPFYGNEVYFEPTNGTNLYRYGDNPGTYAVKFEFINGGNYVNVSPINGWSIDGHTNDFGLKPDSPNSFKFVGPDRTVQVDFIVSSGDPKYLVIQSQVKGGLR